MPASLPGTFRHGVHPGGHKRATAGLPVRRVPFCRRYVLPLSQHIGAPARPVVEAGRRVRRGEPIAEPVGFVSTALHAPVTGVVREVGPRRNPAGRLVPSIEIQADPYDSQRLRPRPPVDPSSLDAEAFVLHVRAGGLVGLGGAAFPSHVKYSLPEGRRVELLVINGAECEPYLTCDHRTMVERPQAVLRGVEILAAKLGVRESIVGVERNKPDAIEALRSHLDGRGAVRIAPVRVKYPQGAEKMLIKAVTGREVPAGKLPLDIGIVVNNVGTMAALADWFDRGVPLVERVVTVTGPGVERPANLLVPLGTPVRELFAACGGLLPQTTLVVMGGPMMGQPLADLDAPVVKGTSGVLALVGDEAALPREMRCIRCGRCLEACANYLNPSRLARLARAQRWEELEGAFVMDCMECGACSYTCPSGIPIVQLIRVAKAELRRRRARS